jgi:hypothetical protein
LNQATNMNRILLEGVLGAAMAAARATLVRIAGRVEAAAT